MKFLPTLLISIILTNCAGLNCQPELVVNNWQPPEGIPLAASEIGKPTVQMRLNQIESITFLTCRYND